jgi:membrane protein
MPETQRVAGLLKNVLSKGGRDIRRSRSGWFGILVRTWHCFQADRIPLVAAGATFYILLALFPAFASIVSLYGLFADRASLAHEIYRASAFLPRGAVITLNAELQRLIAQPPQKAGLTFLVSTMIALWSASGGVKAIVEGLDVAYEVRENRSFLKLSAIALLITALGIVVVAITLDIAVLLPLLFAHFPYRSVLRQMITVLSWPAALAFGMAILSVIYRYGPNRRRHWRWFSWGAVLASAMWLAGTAIFKIYVRNFGSFDRVYGSLGAAIGFMVWIWLLIVIVLLGAELNCEIERSND